MTLASSRSSNRTFSRAAVLSLAVCPRSRELDQPGIMSRFEFSFLFEALVISRLLFVLVEITSDVCSAIQSVFVKMNF